MKKLFIVFLLTVIAAAAFAQQKYALVIGNSNYSGISKLNNPVNDANEMEAALKELGFAVDKRLDADLIQMENAVKDLMNKLKTSKDSYGFFFYAGHGVQSAGENYLIPVKSDIPTEDHLRLRAFSVQAMLDNLNSAGNELNVVVLDACRDNPFGWKRSGSRGLAVVTVPVGSIVVFATSANSTAADGTGKNGLFTSQLLKNIKTPGLTVRDVFDMTGNDVLTVSNGQQYPEISVKYFRTAYLGVKPAPMPVVTPLPALPPTQAVNLPAPVSQSAPTATITQPDPTPQPTQDFLWGPIINPNIGWGTWGHDGATANWSVRKETIEGKERDVLWMTVAFPKRASVGEAHAGIGQRDTSVIRLLRASSNLRFKALGDGKQWRVSFVTSKVNTTEENGYSVIISTKKNKIVDLNIPYKRFTHLWGKVTNFDKSRIIGIEFSRVWEDRSNSELKIFDFEIY